MNIRLNPSNKVIITLHNTYESNKESNEQKLEQSNVKSNS